MTEVMPRTRSQSALGEYLWARRSLVQPETVGLKREPKRRVPGLRRDEVATLAAISPEYYVRLEQGHDKEPSDKVLQGIAKALLLDDNAGQHLIRLRGLHSSGRAGSLEPPFAPGALIELLDSWTCSPAFIVSGNLDVVLANTAAVNLGDGRITIGFNLLESVFSELDRSESDWGMRARQSAAALRYHGNPYQLRFQQIVGRLSIKDDDFRRLWARHDADPTPTGRVRVAEIASEAASAAFHSFEIPGHQGFLLHVVHSCD